MSLAVGIEGGVNQPFIGFDNLILGSIFDIYASHEAGLLNLTISLDAAYYQGKNPGYFVDSYGMRFGFNKKNWRFSPHIEFGLEYIKRRINNVVETGYALDYSLGILIHFHYEYLTIYPKFYYDGIGDFGRQAGFVGIKVGIEYEP